VNRPRQIRVLASIAVLFSMLLAVITIWAFAAYRSSIGEVTRSLAATTLSASKAIAEVANTVKARQELLDETTRTLEATRKLVQEMKVTAERFDKVLPKLAANLKDASDGMHEAAAAMENVAKGLAMELPTGIERSGLTFTIVRNRPLEGLGKPIRTWAERSKRLGETLQDLSTIDVRSLGTAFIDTGERALKLIDESAKATAELKTERLPQAVAELDRASQNLQRASEQINTADQVGIALLALGLLLAGWCAINSISLFLVAGALGSSSIQEALRIERT
jgi:methyl-accepting chemotaxis protein